MEPKSSDNITPAPLAPPAGDTGEKEAASLDSKTKTAMKAYGHKARYEGDPMRWSEYWSLKDENAAFAARSASVPIIHRFLGKLSNWTTHNFKVQDGLMRKALDEVLHNYQDLDLQLTDYTFAPPFRPLCHRWEALKDFESKATEPAMKHAVADLISFLNPILTPLLTSISDTLETGKIEYSNIWQIFAPDTLVSTKFYAVQTTCRVTKYQETGFGWSISMQFIDWNGEGFGLSTTTARIPPYSGYRHVTSLPVFPISFLEDEASYRASMIERGRIFERLRGFHFMVASGTKISIEDGEPMQRPVSGRVCVDAYAYYTSNDIVKPTLDVSRDQDAPGKHATKTPIDTEVNASKTNEDPKFATVRVEKNTTAEKRVENLSPFTDEQHLLATPWVRAFDLKTKQWCEVRVDELTPVAWNDEAFDKLVLPGDEKYLAWEFVHAKSLAQSDQFDDFIPEKGRGLTILMFGPPGTGKTLTAESVADRARVPLYAMSAAELGTAPSDVEKALKRALGLCEMWNAMLLLDEADVFLGVRTTDSIERNELVAIFLRMIEYYKGTMFLTTNRVGSIDTAFQSRIDLFLPYRHLTSEARREVWLNFLQHAGQDRFDITDEGLHHLSQLPLNGREIKNLIKTAQLLSIKGGGMVSLEQVYMLAKRRVEALGEADSSIN